jgi:hypothetical protein
MLEVGMEQHTDELPDRPEWDKLGDRMERAKRIMDADPLVALALLRAVAHDADDITAELMTAIVNTARQKGYKWREIAVASGVEDRQAAWRRWTDKGVPKTRKKDAGC